MSTYFICLLLFTYLHKARHIYIKNKKNNTDFVQVSNNYFKHCLNKF